MRFKLIIATLLPIMLILAAALPLMAAAGGNGATPGGIIVGGHIETNNLDSSGQVCVNVAGDVTCEAFDVQSGEMRVVVPKQDVDNTFVTVTFDGPDGGIAQEQDGLACNRQVLAYQDVMSFCYRPPAEDNTPSTSPTNTIDRFNLVIVQQSPQDRCEPGRGGGADFPIHCERPGGDDGGTGGGGDDGGSSGGGGR